MSSICRVCVFCASSRRCAEPYFQATRDLAEAIVDKKWGLVYGGGRVGLMGTLADTVLGRGGFVLGVIPAFMEEVEWAHRALSELRVVEDMHERVRIMIDESDAFVVLPGGSGTFDEFFQVLTWKRLGLHTKPIVLLNQDGYFDPCLEMLDRMVKERFMNQQHREMWVSVGEASHVVGAIENAPPWSDGARDFAGVK